MPGVDYVYFLDSTMVRLWFLTSRSREPLVEALSSVPGLRLVDDVARARYRIEGCHPSNAHEIFLADPGVVVAPDFFSADAHPPMGMHGYDPDCADNQGVFIAHGRDIPSGDAGVVDATEIHGWTRELLGLGRTSVRRVSPRGGPGLRRFTQSTAHGADTFVGEQLSRVLADLQPLTAHADAILLTGSFGRAEGGAVSTGAGLLAVNDFDLVVVGGPDISSDLLLLREDLAASTGLDFVDVMWTGSTWTDLSPTMLNVDLRYGSRLLSGPAEVLARMPVIPAGDIPSEDGLRLLLNRIGGLLSGMDASMFGGQPPGERATRYLCNQVVKALVAVGDVHLIEWHAYDPSYRVRRDRFVSLAEGAGVEPAVTAAVDVAYGLKVQPDYSQIPDPVRAAIDAAPLMLRTLERVAGQAWQAPVHTVEAVITGLTGDTGAWIGADNARLLAREAIGRLAGRAIADGRSIRHTLYAALTVLLAVNRIPPFPAVRACRRSAFFSVVASSRRRGCFME